MKKLLTWQRCIVVFDINCGIDIRYSFTAVAYNNSEWLAESISANNSRGVVGDPLQG
jgi:hypothetical protein